MGPSVKKERKERAKRGREVGRERKKEYQIN